MQQLLKQLFSNEKYFTRLILPVLVMMMATSLFILPASATGVYQIPSLTADTWILDQGDVISRFNEGQISQTFKDLAQWLIKYTWRNKLLHLMPFYLVLVLFVPTVQQ